MCRQSARLAGKLSLRDVEEQSLLINGGGTARSARIGEGKREKRRNTGGRDRARERPALASTKTTEDGRYFPERELGKMAGTEPSNLDRPGPPMS